MEIQSRRSRLAAKNAAIRIPIPSGLTPVCCCSSRAIASVLDAIEGTEDFFDRILRQAFAMIPNIVPSFLCSAQDAHRMRTLRSQI